MVALSLIASPDDVAEGVGGEQHLGKEIRVMAKFETVAAVQCRAIIDAADGSWCRGDLGLAVGYVSSGSSGATGGGGTAAGKPVVIATHILETSPPPAFPNEPTFRSVVDRPAAGGRHDAR